MASVVKLGIIWELLCENSLQIKNILIDMLEILSGGLAKWKKCEGRSSCILDKMIALCAFIALGGGGVENIPL